MSDTQEPSPDKPKSLFLRANDPDTWEKPDDTTWGDHFLSPNKPLSERHKKLAAMLAMGKRNKDIAETLGYTPARVSVLKSNSRILMEVERLKDKLFERSVADQIKDLGTDAVRVMEEIILNPTTPALKKQQAATWILEKLSGKAKQEVEHNVTSLTELIDRVDKLKESGQVIDVTPSAEDVTPTGPNQAQDVTQNPSKSAKKPDSGSSIVDWIDKNL